MKGVKISARREVLLEGVQPVDCPNLPFTLLPIPHPYLHCSAAGWCATGLPPPPLAPTYIAQLLDGVQPVCLLHRFDHELAPLGDGQEVCLHEGRAVHHLGEPEGERVAGKEWRGKSDGREETVDLEMSAIKEAGRCTPLPSPQNPSPPLPSPPLTSPVQPTAAR